MPARNRRKGPGNSPALVASAVNIPAESTAATTAVTHTQVRVDFEGPLPPPGVLRQYEELVPGCAAAFVQDFRGQVAHRQGLEQAVILSDIHKSELAQHYGFAAFIIVILAAAGVGGVAHERIVAVALAGMDFAGFGGSYIVSLLRGRKQREDKKQQLTKGQAKS